LFDNSLNNTGKTDESHLHIDHVNALDAWTSDDTLCVCPSADDGERYALCSINQDATCVGNLLNKPGDSVSTSRRDVRSVNNDHADDMRERVENVRRKRALDYSNTHLVKVG